MKRTITQAVATANTATRRYRNVLVALAASTSLISCGAAAHAFGGQGLASGERIVSSRVVSDTVVGESANGDAVVLGDSLADSGCANGDAGASGSGGDNVYGDTVYGGTGYGGDVYGDSAGMVQGREYGQPDLFYNFYTQGAANRANAQMYVSPVPVPPHVGQTYITYQPFYPHEMLYKHHDRFHNYYDGGRGMNRTHVSYYYPPVRTGLSNFYWNVLRIPR